MSGLWCDHFQAYANTTQMLDGIYAEIGNWVITTGGGGFPPPRAGASFLVSSSTSQGDRFRRIFGAPKTGGAGVGFRLFPSALPGSDNFGGHNGSQGDCIAVFLSATGAQLVCCYIGSDGGLILCRGGPGVGTIDILLRSDPVITARTWQYVEFKHVPDASAGSFEVRVNGSVVLTYTGNTDPAGTGETSQIAINGGLFTEYGVADLHSWDTIAGNGPTDFTGNVGTFRRELNADTAHADWLLSTGSTGYTLLIDDNDATYIEADSPTGPPKSAFGAGTLPASTSSILYQQVMFRGEKTDSADCDVAPSMISAGVETAVTGQHMTSINTWRFAVFALDPNTSAPWTLAAANASDAAVTRTA